MPNEIVPVEWFNYTEEDLKDTAKCKEVFKHMLDRLETDGHCRHVFHRLAYALFNDDMGLY
jgi:hypothetical protein